MRWSTTPGTRGRAPGLTRWTTVDGATAYEVRFLDAGKLVRTSTNVADEREFYGTDANPVPVRGRVRVRAVREIYSRVSSGVPGCSRSKTSSFAPIVGRLKTRATSAVLPLTPGTWWYRLRGLESRNPRRVHGDDWSRLPASLVVAKPAFRVVG